MHSTLYDKTKAIKAKAADIQKLLEHIDQRLIDCANVKPIEQNLGQALDALTFVYYQLKVVEKATKCDPI